MTGYFVKRRRIQKKLKTGKRRIELPEKIQWRGTGLYHKLANKIVEIAEKHGGIALEDLKSGIQSDTPLETSGVFANFNQSLNTRLN